MRDRDAAKRKAITSNDPHDWKRYKKLRNIINNDIKISKASYYSNAFIQSKGNPRKTWQTFNELTSRRVNNTTVKELKLNDTIISNSSELSDAFNDHFSTIGPRLANEIPLTAENNSSYINNIKVNNNNFSFSSTNCSIVFSHLNKLCRSKATGLDNISAKIVRECADLISVSLCDLFNKSLVSGIFPDDWKCARVTPLFKEGEPSDLNNYRPISVISVIAKVFERIVYDQLYNFLTNEDIISNYQSGFRSLHSTATALLEATDNWAFNIDRGNVNAVVFLDFKKGFSYDADANRLIRQLDWKDLNTQFQIQKSIMVYKSLNGLVPEYLSSKFVKRNETRYSLRDSVNKLFVPFPRTNFMKNSFTYSGAVLWNSLPCHVREAESLSQFKRLVNVHF